MAIWMFVGIFSLCGFVGITLLKPRSGKTAERTLKIIAHKQTDDDASEEEQPLGGWQSFAQQIGKLSESLHSTEDLRLLILHSGSSTTVGSVIALSLVIALGAALLAHVFLQSLVPDLVAFALGASVRWLSLKFQKSRRLKKCNTVLPDAIDLLSRALRAGHAIGSAIEIVAEQSAQPLAAEFSIVFNQQRFGIPFRDAILQLGERVPLKDLHFLITAILVQRESGGDLTEILDRAARVIRERVKIEGEIRTYTAQGRLTGWILSALPLLLLAAINMMSPGYSHVLFDDPAGRLLLYAGGTLILIGGLVIRKIVDIQV